MFNRGGYSNPLASRFMGRRTAKNGVFPERSENGVHQRDSVLHTNSPPCRAVFRGGKKAALSINFRIMRFKAKSIEVPEDARPHREVSTTLLDWTKLERLPYAFVFLRNRG